MSCWNRHARMTCSVQHANALLANCYQSVTYRHIHVHTILLRTAKLRISMGYIEYRL